MNVFQENLWQSLPIPAFLLDPGDIIAEVNPAAESFLNASIRSLRGSPVFDILAIDAPLDDQFKRVRTDHSSLFMNNVDVGTGSTQPVNCNIQMAPMTSMQSVYSRSSIELVAAPMPKVRCMPRAVGE